MKRRSAIVNHLRSAGNESTPEVSELAISQETINRVRNLLDTDQAAALLGIKKNTLEIWRVQGRSPRFLKIGRNVRYRMSDVEAFLEASLRESTSDNGRCD